MVPVKLNNMPCSIFADKYYVDIDKRYVDTSDPFVKAISL